MKKYPFLNQDCLEDKCQLWSKHAQNPKTGSCSISMIAVHLSMIREAVNDLKIGR